MTHMQLVIKQECGRCLIEAQTAQETAFWRVASRRHDATFLVKLLELGRRERACGKRLGKEHVRRLETYSAAIFLLVTDGAGLAPVRSYKPMEV